MRISDFDFALPEDLIAQSPCPERSLSRLLRVTPDALEDRRFDELPALLSPGDLLVFNDTRVLRARLLGVKADTGGRIEVMIERITGEFDARAQVRASKTPRTGTRLLLGEHRSVATVTGRDGEFFLLRFDEPVHPVLERDGRTPLPPYITHAPLAADDARYQTVYGREPGAVAAPTAGLHFDEPLLARLQAAGIGSAFVTLHVGAGTFQPVRADALADHVMHAEWYRLPQTTVRAVARTRAAGGRVIAVGTTSLRTLEAAAAKAAAGGESVSFVADDRELLVAGSGETRLFITPGYRFRIVDALITNFHLPRSTLLMLVSALAGVQRIRSAYAHAIAQRYRFFSYGDAMLLEPAARAGR